MSTSKMKYTLTARQPSMSIAKAKANFSALISSVESGHQSVTISRRGVPVAQVIPFPSSPKPKLRDSMAGTVRVLGDIVSPLDMDWTVTEPEEDEDDDELD